MKPHPLDTALAPFRMLVGTLIASLPRRTWNDWEGRVPVRSMAFPAALVPFAAGFAIGIPAFVAYATRMSDTVSDALLETGYRSMAGQKPPEAGAFASHGMIFALPAFVFFTPPGWLCAYLIGSGLVRFLSWAADDPRGDPILTGLDALARRWHAQARTNRTRAARNTLEGEERPDVLIRGRAFGAGEAVYVVIASRLKADWQPGVLLLTEEGRYRVGPRLDRRLPEGLRAAYPLLEVAAAEVTRNAFPYALPPLSEFDPVTRRVVERAEPVERPKED